MKAAGAAIVVLLAACSAGSPGADEDPVVTIAFAGDVHAASPIDPSDPGFDRAFAELRAADVAMVNLETSVTRAGTPADKRFVFRADPGFLDRLASWGVDVVTMANNHALDSGRDGLRETLEAREGAGLDVIGIGSTIDDAFAPAQATVHGSTVTFLAAKLDDDPTADPTADWAASTSESGVASASDPARLLRAVSRHSGEGPVVVFLHWGVQGDTCPDRDQVDLAAALRRAGADVVVGAHSHTLQPRGRVGDSYVAYGLGNFMWWRQSPRSGSDSGVLTLSLRGEKVTDARWTPYDRSADGSPPRALAHRSAFTALPASCRS